MSTAAIMPPVEPDHAVAERGGDWHAVSRRLVSDLHAPKPAVFWTDLLLSAGLGWAAFVIAVRAPLWSWTMIGGTAVAAIFLYRALCFTHEISHLRKRVLPGFETAWNWVCGVPLLLPSFTYSGVHQSHHSLATYGTSGDPEYLPFARSRRMMLQFGVQSSLIIPFLLLARFVVLAPVALLWPRLHRLLETHASSFAMNPAYRREVSPALARRMKIWELAMLAAWGTTLALMAAGIVPVRALTIWILMLILVSILNTARVLGAHEYESDGHARDRQGQLEDSIDTPGGPWTELWAPVGLRYHALHHYFPGIPYHNLGVAYRRLLQSLPTEATYEESTSPSLWFSLKRLYHASARLVRRD